MHQDRRGLLSALRDIVQVYGMPDDHKDALINRPSEPLEDENGSHGVPLNYDADLWRHRSTKRQGAIRDFQNTIFYTTALDLVAAGSLEEIPAPPDANDCNLSKRTWEILAARWRAHVKDLVRNVTCSL